ncbi:MAG TPA: TQO small subunit DoxD [Chloroflexia bacterium]|nr:TQO small subunit DoxD [Chloroflexia bacterium]
MAAPGRVVDPPGPPGTAIGLAHAEDMPHDDHAHLWPIRLAGVLIGILWFTQILWKLPWNTFGSPGLQPNPTPSAQQPGPFIDNGQGLYHWMTQEAIHGNWLIPFYGDLIKNLALPNWQLVGWMTFFMESFIAISLILGLLSRLGGLVSFVQGLNLFLGLAQAPNEWEWTYVMLFTLGFIFMMTGPGRKWGIDQVLRPRLREQMSKGNGLAGLLYRAT